ncbi:unnamed protein product [Prorocentrum cordatum]|uniref:Ion transport domain-containing protein n=1 Tax=Prorocentrum cordatum TaxID=2364126 RepID=A0ABN9V9A7_9DINO|nr:unnamed protein product [Polarella glacialis]
MEGITALLIAVNTTFMIIEGQYLGAEIGSEIGVYSYYGSDRFSEEGVVLTSDMFGTIEVVFCVLFTIELVVRLTFLRLDFLRDPWGWLDTVIVLTTDATAFFPDLLGQAMPVMTLRVTRLARLLRIMRLARSITAFDSLYLLTTALRGSIYTLVWVIAFLFIT